MRTRVYIATTEGPVLVQRLAPEEGLSEAELSVVCLDGTPTRLPITGAYTYFVRDHVRTLSGVAAYRLDLDRRIDGGDSWMLGAWIAHLLLAEGRLALRDEAADAVVFATGGMAVAPDIQRRAEIRSVGRIGEKVAHLAGRAAEEAGAARRLLLIVPRDNAAEAEAALRRLPEPVGRRIALHAVAEAGDVQGVFTGPHQPEPERRDLTRTRTSAEGGEDAVSAAGGTRRRRGRFLAVLSLCLVAATAAAAHVAWQRVERGWRVLLDQGRYLELARSLEAFPLPVLAQGFRDGLKQETGAGGLLVSVAARRPADGGACAGLRFRGGETAAAPVQRSGVVYRLARLRSLCGFEVRAAPPEGTSPGHVWIALDMAAGSDERRALLPARRLVSGSLTHGPLKLSQALPLFLQGTWAWTLTAVWSPVPSGDVDRLLRGAGSPDAHQSLADLEELGLSVVHATIELAP